MINMGSTWKTLMEAAEESQRDLERKSEARGGEGEMKIFISVGAA